MQWIDIISRIVHVGTAITLVGGSVFMLLVLMPATRELADESSEQLSSAVIGRWRKFVHIGVTLFLVSGIYNYARGFANHEGQSLYHALIGTKMLLAIGVFFLAAALVGRSPALEGFRSQRGKWLKVLVCLAAVIVGISGFVKVYDF
jgi:uncharacterized membrane protein